MTKPRTAVRTPIVIVSMLGLVLAPLLAWSAVGGKASATSVIAPRGIVVVGDSITARYNDQPGDAMQGWWSIVGRHYDAQVTTYAQSGSGYLRPGRMCTGDRFIDRQSAFTTPRAVAAHRRGWPQRLGRLRGRARSSRRRTTRSSTRSTATSARCVRSCRGRPGSS